MVCPCSAAGWVGGWVGGYFGIRPPEYPGGRVLSAILTANLMNITVIALEALFDISLCAKGGFTLTNVIQLGVKTFAIGIIYSIGVNLLLNRCLFPQHNQEVDDSLPEISLALKALLGIPSSAEGELILDNVARMGLKTLPMGIIYSIGINYLLHHYVLPHLHQEDDSLPEEENSPPCCCRPR